MKNRIIVIYDGIHNPVFQGQIVQPLVRWLNRNSHNRGIIISFERKPIPVEEQQLLHNHPQIILIILHKLPFLGSISLRYAARQLNRVLQKYWNQSVSNITARGPLAGRIVALVPFTNAIPVIVQARGLAAQEYRYANPSEHARWLHRTRTHQYELTEQWVYGTYAHKPNVSIQTVSPALRQYLIDKFKAPASKIRVAKQDIPHAMSIQQRFAWRHTMRTKLDIPKDAYVYVYNGSAKPWQCPGKTVQFFMKQYHNNIKSFLLILTQDVGIFKTLLTQQNVPRNVFQILSVSHKQVYKYLATADAGILLREKHIINWVSRPTKMLEYQAVGLRIIHNNTIAMLIPFT